MSHVDDGQLNALLDGELQAEHSKAVEAHLAACAECRARLEEARAFLMAANALLDAAAPPTAPRVHAPQAVTSGVAAGPPRRTSVTAKEPAIDIDGATHQSPAIVLPPRPRAASPASSPAGRRRFPMRSLAWAASIALTFAVGYLVRDVGRVPAGPAPAATPAPSAGHDAARQAAPAAQPSTQSPTAHAPAPAPRQPLRRAAPSGTPSGKRLAPPLVAAPAPRSRNAAAQNAPAVAAVGAAGAPGAPGDQARLAAPVGGVGANAPSPAVAARAAEADLLAERPRAAVPATRFVRVSLDTAVVRLQGTIRLIDGLRPVQVQVGPGGLVDGAARGFDVVRIAYTDARGRGLVLEQQRLPTGVDAASLGMNLLYGDTIVTTAPGLTRIRWLDNRNFWLSLQGPMSVDSLKALIDRVR